MSDSAARGATFEVDGEFVMACVSNGGPGVDVARNVGDLTGLAGLRAVLMCGNSQASAADTFLSIKRYQKAGYSRFMAIAEEVVIDRIPVHYRRRPPFWATAIEELQKRPDVAQVPLLVAGGTGLIRSLVELRPDWQVVDAVESGRSTVQIGAAVGAVLLTPPETG